jgi:hypothetical protein
MRTYRVLGHSSSGEVQRKATGRLVHCVYWKDLHNKSKGCAWILFRDDLEILSGTKNDDDIPIQSLGLDYTLAKARGKKWQALYSDGVPHDFRTSPSVTKRILISIVDRWPNTPLQLKPAKGLVFNVNDLHVDNSSYVYLVKLHVFEATTTGSEYYKIGKAKSIPKRIKQFGPCTLIASICSESETLSLQIEAELHRRFDAWRRPGTEIFSLNSDRLQQVLKAFHESDQADRRLQRIVGNDNYSE